MDAWAPTAVLLIVVLLAVTYWVRGRGLERRAQARPLAGRATAETTRLQTAAPVTQGAWLTPAAENDREPERDDAFEVPASRAPVEEPFEPPLAPLQPLQSLRELPALPPLAACAPPARSSKSATP
jgi:hypothetical protein